MNFKEWLEFNVVGQSTRPADTAKIWQQNINEKTHINQAEIRQVAKIAASPETFAACLAAKAIGNTKSITIYHQLIDGGLIKGIPQKLKKNATNKAYVAIQTNAVVNCKFKVVNYIGEINVVFPNLEYKSIDEIAFVGMIVHECQHAEDWIMDKLKKYDDGSDDVDMNDYLESVAEARAFGTQVIDMVNILQSEYNMDFNHITDAVVAITDGYSNYATAVVKEFMKLLAVKNEATMVLSPTKGKKEQVIKDLAQVFIQEVSKSCHQAGPFFKEFSRRKGIRDFWV
jgi:hypothetical protein